MRRNPANTHILEPIQCFLCIALREHQGQTLHLSLDLLIGLENEVPWVTKKADLGHRSNCTNTSPKLRPLYGLMGAWQGTAILDNETLLTGPPNASIWSPPQFVHFGKETGTIREHNQGILDLPAHRQLQLQRVQSTLPFSKAVQFGPQSIYKAVSFGTSRSACDTSGSWSLTLCKYEQSKTRCSLESSCSQKGHTFCLSPEKCATASWVKCLPVTKAAIIPCSCGCKCRPGLVASISNDWSSPIDLFRCCAWLTTRWRFQKGFNMAQGRLHQMKTTSIPIPKNLTCKKCPMQSTQHFDQIPRWSTLSTSRCWKTPHKQGSPLREITYQCRYNRIRLSRTVHSGSKRVCAPTADANHGLTPDPCRLTALTALARILLAVDFGSDKASAACSDWGYALLNSSITFWCLPIGKPAIRVNRRWPSRILLFLTFRLKE